MSGAGMVLHEAEALGIRFAYPDSLLVGRFAEDSLPPAAVEAGMEPPFRDAVILVPPAVLGAHDLQAIPVGDVPVIWLDRSRSAELAFRVFQPESTYRVTGLAVARFPGFPGPYGDQAHYYVVEVADGEYVEIAAHRHWFGGRAQGETHYDEVIEAIIPTIERIER